MKTSPYLLPTTQTAPPSLQNTINPHPGIACRSDWEFLSSHGAQSFFFTYILITSRITSSQGGAVFVSSGYCKSIYVIIDIILTRFKRLNIVIQILNNSWIILWLRIIITSRPGQFDLDTVDEAAGLRGFVRIPVERQVGNGWVLLMLPCHIRGPWVSETVSGGTFWRSQKSRRTRSGQMEN